MKWSVALYPYFIEASARAGGVLAGFIDREGISRIAPQYADAGMFREGLAPVQIRGRWGLISADGQLVFPCAWSFPVHFIDDFAVVRVLRSGKEWRGFLRRDSTWLVEPKYKLATAFSCGRAQVSDGMHYGFINETGVEVIPLTFEDSRPFREDLAPVKVQGAWGYVNRDGDLAIEPKFGLALPFSEGVARAQMNGKWGFINRLAEWVIPPSFELLFDMHCGRAAVQTRKDSLMGYIDNEGKLAIPSVYDHVTSFREDRAWVKLSGKRFRQCINSSGESIYTHDVIASEPFEAGLSFIETETMLGYIDPAGRLVWRGEYVKRHSHL